MNSIKCTIKLFLSVLFLSIISLDAIAINIAVLSDIHVTPGNANDKKLIEVVNEINNGDTKLVIISGDLTNEGSDEQLINVKQTLDKIAKPVFVIPGNHENNWSQSACKTFSDLWGHDRFVTETDSLIIVGINCGPFMKMGDGHIKQEDLSWLDSTLKERTKNGKRVLSVCHYPILPDLDNYIDYIKILNKYPVVCHLCGHYHAYKHYTSGGIDGLIVRALDMGKGDYGYSILNISSDSVKLYDKVLNEAPSLKYAYKVTNELHPCIESHSATQLLPPNVAINQIYKDSASIFTRVAIDRDDIYFGTSQGYIKSINNHTGKINWQFPTKSALFSRPAITKKYAIFPCGDKRLLWMDKKRGTVVKDIPAQGPYVADGIVKDGILYQGGFKTFQAWNTKTISKVWEYDSIFNYCQAAPAITRELIAFGAWDTNLRLLNRKSGKLLWAWNNGRNANMLGPGNCVPVITKDKVIIVAPDRFMTAISIQTGKEIWRSNKFKVRESLGTSINGKYVYAKTMDGLLVCVSAEDKSYNPLWSVDTGIGYEHAPCIVIEHNGEILIGSRQGTVVAVSTKTHKVLWRYSLGNSEINGFEVDASGDIYASLIEGTIWKISINKN